MRALRDDQEPVDARRHRYRTGEAGRAAASTRARLYATSLEPVLKAIVDQTGRSATAIAREMTCRGLSKPRGSRIWTSADVHKLLRRLDEAPGDERSPDNQANRSRDPTTSVKSADHESDQAVESLHEGLCSR